jgi:hypothetical protein
MRFSAWAAPIIRKHTKREKASRKGQALVRQNPRSRCAGGCITRVHSGLRETFVAVNGPAFMAKLSGVQGKGYDAERHRVRSKRC